MNRMNDLFIMNLNLFNNNQPIIVRAIFLYNRKVWKKLIWKDEFGNIWNYERNNKFENDYKANIYKKLDLL